MVAITCLAVLVPATAAGADTAGLMVITQTTTLTADHAGSIVIAADNLTLDCARHTVAGPGEWYGIAVDNHSGVTIRNCNVTGFVTGLSLAGTRGRVTGSRAVSNVDGFVITGSEHVLTGNVATENAGNGFAAWNGSANELRGNDSHGNGAHGFAATYGEGNVFQGNHAAENIGAGFQSYLSNANLVRENTVKAIPGNWDVGYWLIASAGNVLVDNTSAGNGIGFLLDEDSTGNELRDNVAVGASSTGFSLWMSPANTLTGNRASRSGDTGFSVYNGSDNTILANNTATDSLSHGFAVGLASYNSLSRNTALRNGDVGILLTAGADSNNVSLNVACRNRIDALDESGGVNNEWKDNRFCTPLVL